MVGQGPGGGAAGRPVDELGLADRVRLQGFLPEAEKACSLTGARLHVCASDAEGWGQVVMEAAAYGVPTLARDVPGLRTRSGTVAPAGWFPTGAGADAVVQSLVAGSGRHWRS